MKLKKLLALILSMVMLITCTSVMGITADATLYSLTTYDAELNLSGYSDEELKSVPLSVILDNIVYSDTTSNRKTIGESIGDNISISEEEKIVWTRFLNEKGDVVSDEYSVMERNATVDLSSVKKYTDYEEYSFTMDIIIGSGKQLDPNNVMYNTYVTITRKPKPILSVDFDTIYTKSEDGTRKEIVFNNEISSYTQEDINGEGRNVYSRNDFFFEEYGNVYLGFKANVVNSDNTNLVYPNSEIKIYRTTRGDNTDVTSKVLNQNMSLEETGLFIEKGYEGTYVDKDGVVHNYTNTTSISEEFIVEAYVDGNLLEKRQVVYNAQPNDAMFMISKFELNNINNSHSYAVGEYASIPSYIKEDEEVRIKIENVYDYYSNSINKEIVAIAIGSYSTVEEVLNNNIANSFINCPVGERTDVTIYYTDKANNGEIYDFLCNIVLDVYYSEEKNDIVSVYDEDKNYVYTHDPYFYIYNVSDSENRSLKHNAIDYDDDTYYSYGYQTIFIRKDTDMSKLNLSVSGYKSDKVYDAVKSNKINFSEPQDYSAGRVQYTVSTGEKERNYFVTILKQQTGGAKLYVNGPSERTVNLDDYFRNRHDIIIANMGDEELTGLNVEWSVSPKNVKLHDYWTVGGENNSTLYPMNENNYMAKIRLIPDGEGEISGQLKISADGQEPIFINISGHAGNPHIVTNEELIGSVKNVPYSAIIATDNIYEWNDVTYKLTSGILPEGVILNSKTGEIYGVPLETGLFEFTVKATFSESAFLPAEKSFKLLVLDNTNENVYLASDENYEIITHLGYENGSGTYDYYVPESLADRLFTSNGEYNEFIDLWLNGEKLEKNVDYTYEEGSTKITVLRQTFGKLEKGKPNTIAAEFRIDGDLNMELKRTAQNFTIGNLDNEIPVVTTTYTGSSSPIVPVFTSTNIPVTPTVTTTTTTTTTTTVPPVEEANSEVENVIELINKISDDVTEKEAEKIEKARNAYDALTDTQKELVENYDKLVSAEEEFEKLEEEKSEEIKEEPKETEESEGNEISTGFIGRVYGNDGEKLSDISVEIHSEVQNTTTDSNGVFKFEAVEFGMHTLTLTDKNGKTASKKFTLKEGNVFEISDNEIVAEAYGLFEVNMIFDGVTIEFLESDEEIPTKNTEGKVDGETEENPKTAVVFPFAAIIAAGGFSYGVMRFKRKK